jgi:hypothetical protein
MAMINWCMTPVATGNQQIYPLTSRDGRPQIGAIRLDDSETHPCLRYTEKPPFRNGWLGDDPSCSSERD